MFKRVEKRRKKKEEEEELGLDEDMKDVLGMQDTDSDESDSDSDQSSDEGAPEGDEEFPDIGAKSDANDEGVSEEEDTGEEPLMTVREALRDPLYIVALEPEVKGCIVCPGKLLKGTKMIDIHKISNAHKRRVQQFAVLAAKANPDNNAWDVLQRGSEKTPKLSLTPSETSKRAEKRKAKAAAFKAKRERQKAKAKKAAKDSTLSTELTPSNPAKPMKKRRKLDSSLTQSDPKEKSDKSSSLLSSKAPEITPQKLSPSTPKKHAVSQPNRKKMGKSPLSAQKGESKRNRRTSKSDTLTIID